MKRKWERNRERGGARREETQREREAYRRLSQRINGAQFGATAKSGSSSRRNRRSRGLELTL